MNAICARLARWLAAVVVAVGSACATGPMEPAIRLEKVAQPAADGTRWQQVEPVAAGLRVWRDDRPLRPATGMRLEKGDVVETAPGSAALIRFGTGGSTVLDGRTRVRIGSLEVFFGRVFADVRGFFQTASETVVAGVAGTRFLFQVRPDRSTRIAVAQGEVTCSPRRGSWSPIRLHPGEALAVTQDERGQPPTYAADPDELREAAAFADSVAAAAAQGWCCFGGRVQPARSDACPAGRFSTVLGEAESFCLPPSRPELRREPRPEPRREPPYPR
jgi:hypothetical protein